jgi:hypothetical protein
VARTGMSRCQACVVVVFLVAGARVGPAAAQGPRDGAELPIAALLEQRVPEELAVEGLMLSRRGLQLQVEQVGTRLLVSLVDRSTSRVAASTTLDHISADRDAAVATVTHVVADLAAEIAARAPPPPEPEVTEDGGDRSRRDAAEQRFRREAIGFGNDVTVYLVATPERHVAGASQRWFPFKGELKTRLEPAEFYQLVGRADLADSYRERRTLMLQLYWGGGGLTIGSAVVGLAAHGADGGTISRLEGAALVGFCGGLVALAAARWLESAPQPIGEKEARSLAEQYNLRLRRQLGLPAAARARTRDVRIVPYATGRDAGIALTTGF